ncbi:hypothetical protein Pint_30058 [Pistacia integerrima]|uniref:Uncharacterized protein n=1 Tax=Pistacia integerrima TaxID=434235 RepID=A0ACC0X3Y8_9ROSI|nr:hypothetical protein Pint_30058 [Pistacia integerrima]
MPKDRRVQSLSFDRSRASPYPCNSSSRDPKPNKLEILEDTREWEEVRCPICLEHPHNAVLLHCSSSKKGCQPYMCNTSYRHSNCLDQFLKTSASTPSTEIRQDIPSAGLNSSGTAEEASLSVQSRHDVRLLQPKLGCPLCRGEIYGYSVVEAARQFMNSKVRSCSCENCDFSGSYSELRKHARSDHPSTRPTEVDPERQHDWRRLEDIRGFRDFLTIMQPVTGEEDSEENASSDFMLYLLLGSYLIYEVEEFLVSRDRQLVHDDRVSRRPLRFRYDRETNYAPRHRSMNDTRPGRTNAGRHNNMEVNRSSRWIDSSRAGRVNHGRYSNETNHFPRWNDYSRPRTTNPGQGLRWRGQQRSRFNNQRFVAILIWIDLSFFDLQIGPTACLKTYSSSLVSIQAHEAETRSLG